MIKLTVTQLQLAFNWLQLSFNYKLINLLNSLLEKCEINAIIDDKSKFELIIIIWICNYLIWFN